MSIFVKLNLHEIRYFGDRNIIGKQQIDTVALKRNCSSFKKFHEMEFRVIDFGLMQKSITRNSISRNTSDRQVDCGETYYKTFDEELKYFIIVVLEMQQNKPFQTF